jgi:hypothetical protein
MFSNTRSESTTLQQNVRALIPGDFILKDTLQDLSAGGHDNAILTETLQNEAAGMRYNLHWTLSRTRRETDGWMPFEAMQRKAPMWTRVTRRIVRESPL